MKQTAESLYGECNAAELGFTKAEFFELLEEVIAQGAAMSPSGRDRTALLSGLRVDDLVLARACARGNERAWDRFLTLYREKLYRSAAAMAREESTARELADSLYADLYGTRLRDGRRISKLESYMGRGSLEGWLRTVLAQEHVNRLRSRRKLVAFEDAVEEHAARETPPAGDAPENAQLMHAVDAALESLPSEERFLLAAHYLDERTLAEIGRMLGVHESTVSRRVEKITVALRKKIVANLCRHGIAKKEAEALMDLDVRDLGVDVRKRLAQERRG